MRKSVILIILACTVFLSIIPLVQAATVTNSPSLSGIQIFPKDNIWNTRVDKLPVDAKSNIYINDLVKDTAPYNGLRHYIKNAIPYNVVTSAQRHQYITSFVYPAYSDDVPFPIPSNPLYELGCPDYHLEIVDVDEMKLYELSAAHKNSDGTWSGAIGAVWDLKSNKFRSNETPMWSANEAGIPILSGLVRYDEVSAGSINHALRISVPKLQNTWVWPARSTTMGDVTDPKHAPAGQRFRLKASFDISGYPPQAKVILQALKTYGAIVATNNGMNLPPAVVGSPDTRWDFDDLNTLWRVNISNFEAVDVSSIMIDKNSMQARQPGTTPTGSSITVTSPNGGESWQRGTTHTITWSYTGSPGSSVKIMLVKGSTEVGTITSSTSIGSSGTGSYTWPISADGLTGGDFKISVQSTSQSTIRDSGNNYFTVTPVGTTTTPSITVTSPDGGESWQRGTTPTVTWSYTGSPGSTVRIVLLKAGTEVGTIISSTSIGSSGKGSCTWPISSDGLTGSDFTVSVQSTSLSSIRDSGNNYFTITSGSTPTDPEHMKVGIFNGVWNLDINGNGAWDGPMVDQSFRYGAPGDAPIVGDWDGDGKDGIAIFRNATGFWYFDYDLDGTVDTSFRFGGSTDRIIAGDWDGDGKDGIAIFRPSTGYWYFDYNLDGKIDTSFRYGGSTDRIIAGDWDGDGKDGIAIFRPSTGYWYFDYNLDGKIDTSFRYGGSTDRIIAGDWDGDGKDGIAIFRPSTGYWYFDHNLDGKINKSFRYGGSTDRIIAGDWDGDGIDGIGIFRPSTGYWYLDFDTTGSVDKAFKFGTSDVIPVIGEWS